MDSAESRIVARHLPAQRESELTAMLTGRNIICFSNDWRNDPTSKHQIMKILSRRNMVIWVNSIGLRKPDLGKRDLMRIFGKARSFLRGLEKVHENFYVFTPVVIPFHDSGFIRGVNALILLLSLLILMKV